MKKTRVLSLILLMAILLSSVPTIALAEDLAARANLFKDMPTEGHWSREALKSAVDKGLLNGFTEKDGIYIKPKDPLTRAQLATIVNRAFEAKDVTSLSGVNDVASSAWYYKEMQKAVKMGTMKLDNRMRPNDNITRQEAFTIVGRALKMENGSKSDISQFSDGAQVANWAAPAMGAMVKAAYIKGDKNLLNPNSNMTRAEFAVLMDNLAPIITEAKDKPREENEAKEEIKAISAADLTSEQGIREYLVGEWSYEERYLREITCKMDIDKDLNVKLSFKNTYSEAPKGDYKGKITFDRIYADSNQAPDIISLELMDSDKAGGDFFFLHRTIYNNKRVMSWFFAGNGNSIFDVADFTGDQMYTSEEVMFEKVTGEKSQGKVRQNDAFYAVYWGMAVGVDKMWLDDVEWTPAEDDYPRDYPARMTNYNNDSQESILYSVAPEEVYEVLGKELTEGDVYYVETDKQGQVKYFIAAEEKKWMDSNYITPEIRQMVIDSLSMYNEINDYLMLGMTIEFDGETIMIEGEEFYKVALGTQHQDRFVRELHYAVQTYTGEVYWYDILNDIWKPMAMG